VTGRAGRWAAGAVRAGGAAAVAAAAVRAAPAAGRRPYGIGVQGMVPWLLLPAYPAAALAAARRRPLELALLAGVAAAHARWTAAEVGRPGPAPAGGVPFRLATANLLLDNPDPVPLVAGLTAAGPDVLLLQELTPAHLARLAAAGALDPYPHRLVDAREWVHGGAVLSRWPLAGGTVFELAGSPLTRADVVTPAGPVRVVNVHLVAPLGPPRVTTWHAQLAGLAELAAPAGGHLVLAGDFNATGQHRPLARLLRDTGLRDAQRVAGGGLAPTWPTGGHPPGFPVLRLDHVLVGPAVGVAGLRRAAGPGSDHRPLVADLVLPAAGGR
jgi:endonuclease/exonuclease/phosphatase (EEP) superfamily protein YafD